MPTITDNAICIRKWDFSESSQTVSLFTRGHGVIRGLGKGSKRHRGAFSGGMDVLTRGEIIAIIKPGRELAVLTAWHLQDSYRILRESLQANRAAVYMADIIHHLILDHDPHPRLFDAFARTLDSFKAVAEVDRRLLQWQWLVLEDTGYKPELDRDAGTGAALPNGAVPLWFDSRAGGIVSRASTAQAWRVRRETVDVLRSIAHDDGAGPVDPVSIGRANRLLAAYFREIIGSEPSAMRWAFGELAV